MEAILDSSFILSSIKSKIDFVAALEEKGFTVKVPKEVLLELKDLRQKVSHDERVAIDLGLELMEKSGVKKMVLGKNKVDLGLISRGKTGSYIATLDNAIRREIPNAITLSSTKKDILIERK